MTSMHCRTAEIERVYDYAQQVLDGGIVACKKVRMACRRFFDDLERSETDPEWPWAFDEVKAARPIVFMERYLTPSKGDCDRFELMGWQVFCEANLYGWVDRRTGLRRFTEGLIAREKDQPKDDGSGEDDFDAL